MQCQLQTFEQQQILILSLLDPEMRVQIWPEYYPEQDQV